MGDATDSGFQEYSRENEKLQNVFQYNSDSADDTSIASETSIPKLSLSKIKISTDNSTTEDLLTDMAQKLQFLQNSMLKWDSDEWYKAIYKLIREI